MTSAVTLSTASGAMQCKAAGSAYCAGSAAIGFTGCLLALRGSFAIIPEPARPELGENIIGRTRCEAPK